MIQFVQIQSETCGNRSFRAAILSLVALVRDIMSKAGICVGSVYYDMSQPFFLLLYSVSRTERLSTTQNFVLKPFLLGDSSVCCCWLFCLFYYVYIIFFWFKLYIFYILWVVCGKLGWLLLSIRTNFDRCMILERDLVALSTKPFSRIGRYMYDCVYCSHGFEDFLFGLASMKKIYHWSIKMCEILGWILG